MIEKYNWQQCVKRNEEFLDTSDLKKYVEKSFDVDKVIEQLEEIEKKYSQLSLAFNGNIETQKYIGMEQAIAVAIEIVKENEVE